MSGQKYDVAMYEKIPPKESVNFKELRSKWGIYLPFIRWDVAMETAFVHKVDNQHISLILTVPILVNLFVENLV